MVQVLLIFVEIAGSLVGACLKTLEMVSNGHVEQNNGACIELFGKGGIARRISPFCVFLLRWKLKGAAVKAKHVVGRS